MKNKGNYKLLYNNLWLIDRDKAQKLDVTANLGQDWGKDQSINLNNNESANFITPKNLPNNTLKNPIRNMLTSNIKDSPAKISTSDNLITDWDILVSEINNCAKCDLCHGRQNVVIERGTRFAKWMFVGEGPGQDEDIQGKPFVGASGQLLEKMIKAMKLDSKEDVYICNVVKCRPPYNRNPEPHEIEECQNYLFSQIALVKPQIIIALGRFACQTLLETNDATGRLRKKLHYYQNIPLIVTYHPSYLLRNPSAKKDAWEDLQLAIQVFKGNL